MYQNIHKKSALIGYKIAINELNEKIKLNKIISIL